MCTDRDVPVVVPLHVWSGQLDERVLQGAVYKVLQWDGRTARTQPHQVHNLLSLHHFRNSDERLEPSRGIIPFLWCM